MTLEERINEAADDAQEAFWEVVAKKFPEVKTGDFSPEAQFAFDGVMKSGIMTWLAGNMDPQPPELMRLLISELQRRGV